MNNLLWLLRRETWEHRSFFVVPAVFLSLIVLVYGLGLFAGTVRVDDMVFDRAELLQHLQEGRGRFLGAAAGAAALFVPALVLNAAMLFVWFFYLLDALYGERKDRSVLFWKSLPVSDTQTVGSKLLTAMFTVPAITLAGVLVGALAMSVINTLFAWLHGQSAWQLVWSQLPLLSGALFWLYAFLVQSLWYVPVFGWLLLASAWAPRSPLLWALLPPVAVAIFEGSLTGGGHLFGELLLRRLRPVVPTAFTERELNLLEAQLEEGAGAVPWHRLLDVLDPMSFLTDPGMWGGLVVGGLFLTAAVWLRRFRVEA